jgi:clan AA aspartic protease (TIGR02281 family)
VLLSREIGRQLGLGAKRYKQNVELQLADGRKIKADYVVLESLSVQGVEASDVAAAILSEDIGDISYKDGLLGMSFLKNFSFKIDQKNSKLILEKMQ